MSPREINPVDIRRSITKPQARESTRDYVARHEIVAPDTAIEALRHAVDEASFGSVHLAQCSFSWHADGFAWKKQEG